MFFKITNPTYLIGHNNPINGFQPAAIHPSRRLCFLRAYASFSHQSMTGVVLHSILLTDKKTSSSPTSAVPRIKYPFRRSILLHMNDVAEPTQPMDINTLHKVYWLLNLMRKSSPNRILPKIFWRTFLSKTLTTAASVLNGVHASLRHKEARVEWECCRVLLLSYETGLCYSIAHWDHSSRVVLC